MTVHLVSETEFGSQGMGIHTAHRDLIGLLSIGKSVDLKVNNEGVGDVFHAHTYGPYYFLKGLKYKGRRIHTVHTIPATLKGSVPFFRFVKPFADLYFKWVFNYADVCIAISPEVERTLKELKVKSRIVRINNPINLENWRFSENKKKTGRSFLGINENEFVVLGVGQMQQRKGIEDFIDLAESMPQFKFVWVGGRPFGKLTEGIKRIDKRIKNAPSNILFTGIVGLDEMPNLYAAADVFVFPSYQENSPLAPIEAASAELPVIYRDLDEYKSLYTTAYLKASSNQEFKEQICRLFVDENFFSEAKENSRQIVKQFDEKYILKQILDLYNQLFDSQKW